MHEDLGNDMLDLWSPKQVVREKAKRLLRAFRMCAAPS
jgi:hypothetical protein